MEVAKAPPSTPRANATMAMPPPTPSATPGTWRHPRFVEILSRQNAATFTEQDFKRAAANMIALVLSFAFGSELDSIFHALVRPLSNALSQAYESTAIYTGWLLLALRLYFLFNLSVAVTPLSPYAKRDTLSDIPLTPSQRALMGLPPSPSPSRGERNAKATPTSSGTGADSAGSGSPSPAYFTPPRYKRRSFSPSPSPSSPLNNSIYHHARSKPSSPTQSIRSSSATSPSPLNSNNNNTTLHHHRHHHRTESSPQLPSTSYSPLSAFLLSTTARSASGSPLLQKALTSSTNVNMATRSHQLSLTSPETNPAGAAAMHRSNSTGDAASSNNNSNNNNSVIGGDSTTSRNGTNRSAIVNYKWLFEKERRRNAGTNAGNGLLGRSESFYF